MCHSGVLVCFHVPGCWNASPGDGAGADAGLRPGGVREDEPARRLGAPCPAAGRLAVAGCRRRRSGAVLAVCRRGAGQGGDRRWRAGRPAAPRAPAGLAGDGRDRPHQRAGRPVRGGHAPAGRLPAHPGATDPRQSHPAAGSGAADAAAGAGQPRRPAAAAGPAAGPRSAGRAARARPALHHGGDRRPAAGDLRAAVAGVQPGRRREPHRGMGRRPAARRPLAGWTPRPGRLCGHLLGQRPVCARLPGRGGAGPATCASARRPAGDIGAGAAVGPALRRRPCPGRQPAAARAGRTGQPVPGAAGRATPLVALPPSVRRSVARPPAADLAGAG